MTIQLVANEPSAQIVTATKPLVDALLAMNTQNRKLREKAVARIVDDIRNGAWLLTASGIGVDQNGVLSDGQHRLEAIRSCGYPPLQFVLATGLNPKAQAVVDRHAKRSLSDALSLIQGRTVKNATVAAANALLSIKGSTDKATQFMVTGKQPSDSASAKAVDEWQDDINVVLQAAGSSPRSSVIAAIAVYYRHQPANALEFANQINKGVNLSDDDPAYRFREFLTRTRGDGGSRSSLIAFRYAVTAVTNHALSRKLKVLRPSDSWENAPFKPWEA